MRQKYVTMINYNTDLYRAKLLNTAQRVGNVIIKMSTIVTQ